MTSKIEKKLLPVVQSFVTGLNGRYKDHCSDTMLVSLLMWRLADGYGSSKARVSRAEAVLDGDPNAAYDAACCLFERILEHGCQAAGNGHHVAQDFAAISWEKLPSTPQPVEPPRELEEARVQVGSPLQTDAVISKEVIDWIRSQLSLITHPQLRVADLERKERAYERLSIQMAKAAEGIESVLDYIRVDAGPSPIIPPAQEPTARDLKRVQGINGRRREALRSQSGKPDETKNTSPL